MNHCSLSLSVCHNTLQWDYAFDEEDEEIPLSVMCSNPVLYNATSGIFLVYSKQSKASHLVCFNIM